MADGDTRTHFVGVRLSRAEIEAVDGLALRAGTSRAQVLRGAALREAEATGAGTAALEVENRILREQAAELRTRLDAAGRDGAAGWWRRLLGR